MDELQQAYTSLSSWTLKVTTTIESHMGVLSAIFHLSEFLLSPRFELNRTGSSAMPSSMTAIYSEKDNVAALLVRSSRLLRERER